MKPRIPAAELIESATGLFACGVFVTQPVSSIEMSSKKNERFVW
jgi:hypothetical protein